MSNTTYPCISNFVLTFNQVLQVVLFFGMPRWWYFTSVVSESAAGHFYDKCFEEKRHRRFFKFDLKLDILTLYVTQIEEGCRIFFFFLSFAAIFLNIHMRLLPVWRHRSELLLVSYVHFDRSLKFLITCLLTQLIVTPAGLVLLAFESRAFIENGWWVSQGYRG